MSYENITKEMREIVEQYFATIEFLQFAREVKKPNAKNICDFAENDLILNTQRLVRLFKAL